MPRLTSAEKMRRQRERDAADGVIMICVRVPAGAGAAAVRELARRLREQHQRERQGVVDATPHECPAG